jgi:hypothetical protein
MNLLLDPESGIRYPISGIRYPGSGMDKNQDTGSWICNTVKKTGILIGTEENWRHRGELEATT